MEKQIDFKGVCLTPYSDISPDGQLSVCSNLERHAGSLRPTVLHGTEYFLPEEPGNVRIISVHNTSGFSHFIFYDDDSGTLYWSSQDAEGLNLQEFGTVAGIVSISTVGNTLVIINEEGINYFLFSDNQYNNLGTFPEISLSFGLRGYGERMDPFPLFFERINAGDIYKPLNENNRRAITDAVMSRVNGLVERETNEKGRFMFPFFVRYAYRLYDGTLTHHSAPILMLCPSMNPIGYVNFSGNVSFEYYEQATFCVTGASHELDYCASFWKPLDALKKWKDIIKSVDVFVSQPVFSFTPDGLCTQFEKLDNFPASYTVCKHMNGSEEVSQYYQYHDLKTLCFNTFLLIGYEHYIKLPYKDVKEMNELIADNANFYLLKSIPVNEISLVRQVIKTDGNTLKNLSFQEKMTDDYNSHEVTIPSYSYVYNSRLNIANLKKQLYQGYNTESVFCYNGPGYYNGTTSVQRAAPHTCYVYIKENGKEYILQNRCDIPLNDYRDKGTFIHFYYPNVNAYKVVIHSPVLNKVLTLELKPHNFLNGAYFFDGFGLKDFSTGNKPEPTVDNMVPMPNKIYTSEVGNPFYFPLSGINTVGVGEIVGMSAVTTALSQGQFGQYPLMVFCTDGNYAMQVNAEGLFAGISPMQRDVCTAGQSITQIDGAVIFVSAKGVMTADGALIQCISEVLNGVSDLTDEAAGFLDAQTLMKFSLLPPVEFFQECVIAYDYAGKRLLFFSTSEDMAWVMSLEDTSWSQAQLGKVKGIVNVYPYSYIQFSNTRKIVRLDHPYMFKYGEQLEGQILTRPLKLDSLQYKSMHELILEGNFREPQRITLYGSNNGNDWFMLGKSTQKRILIPGRYFKYYRLGIRTKLTETENLSGVRIEYSIRPERRLR